MFGPLDLRRLALRIQQFQVTPTTGWRGGDDLQFKNQLPTGHAENKLPTPEFLRELADNYTEQQANDGEEIQLAKRKWRIWIQIALRMDTLIRNNDPMNPRNQMRRMMMLGGLFR